MNSIKISSALISVFDKKGLKPILENLVKNDIQLYSTGGTEEYIRSLGYNVIPVEKLTNYPSIIIPTHWDDFRVPYGASQENAAESKAFPFIEEVKILSPKSKTFLPVHLKQIQINDL